jgi:hypothetical protein
MALGCVAEAARQYRTFCNLCSEWLAKVVYMYVVSLNSPSVIGGTAATEPIQQARSRDRASKTREGSGKSRLRNPRSQGFSCPCRLSPLHLRWPRVSAESPTEAPQPPAKGLIDTIHVWLCSPPRFDSPSFQVFTEASSGTHPMFAAVILAYHCRTALISRDSHLFQQKSFVMVSMVSLLGQPCSAVENQCET